MTDAREIINAACINVNQWRDQTYASAIITALHAAGFRILGPDEVGALDRLMARADAWPLNSDSARVSVRLGDLRALGRKA
jgi:hypothetical protein